MLANIGYKASLTMGTEKPVVGELPSGMTAVTVTLNTSPLWIGL